MQGMNLIEQGHIVNVLPPIDVQGGAVGDRFSMAKYGKANIFIQIGVSESAFTAIILRECDQASGGTATDIAFNYYAETTANGDTFGARTAADSTGVTPSANDNIMYAIDLDARDLSDGYPWVEVALTNGSVPVQASIIAVLTGARYGHDQSETVLS